MAKYTFIQTKGYTCSCFYKVSLRSLKNAWRFLRLKSTLLQIYSGVHKRSDAYSNLLSKPQLLSMTWRTFKILLPAWQSGSKQNLIGGFQKGRTCSCISRDTKVAGCQTFFIFQKLHFSFYISYFHMKTVPPMNTFDFFKY